MRAEFSSGVGADRIADPTAKGGVTLVHFRMELGSVWDEDGLAVEMERRLPPRDRMPWQDRDSHDRAIRQLERGPYPGLSEQEQRDAVEYIRETAHYEW